MDAFEQEYTIKPRKKSPYADAPYESAYIEPEQQKPVVKKAPKQRKHRGLTVALVLVLLMACCVGTAVGVGAFWQKKMRQMENAMEDKFQALEQIYNDNHSTATPQVTQKGYMTPSQVYAENVRAVVAVNSLYEGSDGYMEGIGSGFIISEDGYVVTNCHVIDGATEVVVITYEGAVLDTEVVGYDATNDIALLKAEGKGLPFVTIGSSDKLNVGDQVAAIGNPLGELVSTMTVGYISAKDRFVDTDGTTINMLQTDAAINSGNSGGPLFNMRGEVVGITTAKYSGDSSSGVSIEGLGFAIPIDDVVDMIADLKEFGYVTGAYLGVYVRDVEASAQYYGLPAGAFVEEPMQGMAAERAGIQAGDIIVNLGGYDVTSVAELTRVLRRFDAGDKTSVTVYRQGKMQYLTVILDEKPVAQEEESVPEEVPVPDNGDYEKWFEYFAPFFGFDGE